MTSRPAAVSTPDRATGPRVTDPRATDPRATDHDLDAVPALRAAGVS